MIVRPGDSVSVFGIIEGMELFSSRISDGPLFPLVQTYEHRDDPLWKFPGGGREFRETFGECLLREIQEEVCVNVYPPLDEDLVFEERVRSDHVFLAYRVKFFNGVLIPGHEITRVELFSTSEIRAFIRDGEMAKRHAMAFEKYLATLRV